MSALWGLPYLFIKVAVAEMDVPFLVSVRLVIPAALLLPIAFASGSLAKAATHWRLLVAIGVIGIAAPFLLIAFGEQHIASSLAALLIAADPLFIVLLALRFDRTERASGTRLLGLVLGFVGVAALLGLHPSGDRLVLLGAAMVLLAAVCYAASALLVKRLRGVPMLAGSTASLSVAALVLLPALFLDRPTQVPSLAAILSVLGLAIPCTAVAYVLYYHLIAEAGATRASLITYVNPAVAAVLGMLVLGEPITAGIVLGFVLIVAGCALSTGAVRLPIPTITPRRSAEPS